MISGITVEQLFSRHCSGHKFRHDQAMTERFGKQNLDMAFSFDSQRTPQANNEDLSAQSSAPVLDCNKEPSVFLEDDYCRSATNPELGSPAPEVNHYEIESAEELASIADVDPASLQDSQDSVISDIALETRLQAFRTVLDNAKGRVGGEVRLLSTTDHHSTIEPELGFEETKTFNSGGASNMMLR